MSGAARPHAGLRVIWYALLVLLYAPLAVVVVYSFNSVNSSADFVGVSLRWYRALFADDAILSAAWNSAVLALVSSVIATAVGTAMGYGLYAHRDRRLGALIALIYLPIIMPDIVYGIAQLSFFSRLAAATEAFDLGLSTMIIAHVSFQAPFVALLVYSRLVGLDPRLFDACSDLYASAWQRARFFILPTLQPAIVAGFFLALTLSIDDFVISYFTSGPESVTLPIFIWSAIKRGVSPEINAIATLMIGTVFAAAAITLAFQYVRARRAAL